MIKVIGLQMLIVILLVQSLPRPACIPTWVPRYLSITRAGRFRRFSSLLYRRHHHLFLGPTEAPRRFEVLNLYLFCRPGPRLLLIFFCPQQAVYSVANQWYHQPCCRSRPRAAQTRKSVSASAAGSTRKTPAAGTVCPASAG